MAAASKGAGAATQQKQPQSPALQLSFGKRLAHTDKVVRDRGFRTLKEWLKKHPELERLDYLKLWKGLYFAMWMADKRLVQQDLAVQIALLINSLPAEKQGVWVDTFWETMHESWEKLDVHRMNKYMLFVRIVVAEAFKALRLRGWELEEVRQTAATFTRGAAECGKGGPNVRSLGLQIHYARLFWDELCPQLAATPEVPPGTALALLEPLAGFAETSHSAALVGAVHEHVLRKAPAELAPAVASRCLAALARPGVLRKNREALQATLDALREKHQLELPEAALAAAASAGAGAREVRKKKKVPRRGLKAEREAAAEVRRRKIAKLKGQFPARPARAEKPAQPPADVEEKREVAEGGDADRGPSMSPLMLPRAAIDEDGFKEVKLKKGAKKKKRQPTSPATGGAAAAAATPAAGAGSTAKRKSKAGALQGAPAKRRRAAR